MYSRTDLVIEALAAGVGAVAAAVLMDRLQIGRRALDDLGRGPAPSRATVYRMMARARLAEALVAMLVFRGAMGVTRRLLRGLATPPRLEGPEPSLPPGRRAIAARRASPGSAAAT